MAQMIIFIVFISLTLMVSFGALGLYMMDSKGQNKWLGFAIGGLLPVIGLLIISLMGQTDKSVVEEMYNRNFITKDEMDQTVETIVKKED